MVRRAVKSLEKEPSLIVYAKSAKISPYTSFGIDFLAGGSTMSIATIAKVDAINDDNELELLELYLLSHWSDRFILNCVGTVLRTLRKRMTQELGSVSNAIR